MGNRPKTGQSKNAPRVAANKDRVVVAYIHPGQTSAYFTQSLVNLMMFDQATERHIVGCLNEWSSANVSASRNNIVSQFLDRDADWLLFIDADMAFEHDSLPTLLASADAVERPVVGGLCFGMSGGQLFPTIYQMVQTPETGLTTMRVYEYEDDALVPVAATGAAFLLIHRTVLEGMRDKGFNAAFPWFQETVIGDKPAGEDITFCIRAGLSGFPVFVNTGVRIGHHKSHVLDHDMFRAQRAAMAGDDDDAPHAD